MQAVYTQNSKHTKFESKIWTFSCKIKLVKHIETNLVQFFLFTLFNVYILCRFAQLALLPKPTKVPARFARLALLPKPTRVPVRFAQLALLPKPTRLPVRLVNYMTPTII